MPEPVEVRSVLFPDEVDRVGTPVYDRTARGVRVAGTAGALVDGRI